MAIRIVHLLVIATFAGSFTADSRGVRVSSSDAKRRELDRFDPTQSAALFVGVRRFSHDTTIAEVRHAVDDVVDLAFVLALDERVRLIEPRRIVLALSGEPQKPESQHNLDRLVAAGAKVRPAGQSDILAALDEQARATGRNGLLAIAFATHGVSHDGTQYLLAASSLLNHRETTLSESKIRDIASRSDAARSLILVDACRERLVDDQRSSGPDVRSAASLHEAMDSAHGQVVLSAAAAGQYAYDDDERGNGVFTSAVIDGLRCAAPTDADGLVTIDTLSAFVEQRVLEWIRKNRNVDLTRATQLTWEGQARAMPLAACRSIASVAQPAGCTISVDSSPRGATVTLEGKALGVTPLSISLAKEQRAEVVLARSGYRAATADVDCSRSEPVFVMLRPRAAGQQVLLNETFDNNSLSWPLSNDPDAPAELKGGSYILGSKRSEIRVAATPVSLDEDADFHIAVSVRRLHGEDEQICGLIWGVANPGTFAGFFINGRGNVSVGFLQNGGGAPLNDTSVVHPSVGTRNATNRLKIAKVGDRVRYYVNDTLVHERAYQPLFGSGIGLAAISGPIVAAFDDLEVVGNPR